jgi:hypothetical protein
MTEPIFGDERLDGYRLSMEHVASSYRIAKSLNGSVRDVPDQWFACRTIDPTI